MLLNLSFVTMVNLTYCCILYQTCICEVSQFTVRSYIPVDKARRHLQLKYVDGTVHSHEHRCHHPVLDTGVVSL